MYPTYAETNLNDRSGSSRSSFHQGDLLLIFDILQVFIHIYTIEVPFDPPLSWFRADELDEVSQISDLLCQLCNDPYCTVYNAYTVVQLVQHVRQ